MHIILQSGTLILFLKSEHENSVPHILRESPCNTVIHRAFSSTPLDILTYSEETKMWVYVLPMVHFFFSAINEGINCVWLVVYDVMSQEVGFCGV